MNTDDPGVPPGVPIDALTPLEAAAELDALAEEITAHDKAYYQNDAPSIADADYDSLRRRLQAIEIAFPDLARGVVAIDSVLVRRVAPGTRSNAGQVR